MVGQGARQPIPCPKSPPDFFFKNSEHPSSPLTAHLKRHQEEGKQKIPKSLVRRENYHVLLHHLVSPRGEQKDPKPPWGRADIPTLTKPPRDGAVTRAKTAPVIQPPILQTPPFSIPTPPQTSLLPPPPQPPLTRHQPTRHEHGPKTNCTPTT